MKALEPIDNWRSLFATSEPTRHPTAAQQRLASHVRSEYARTGEPTDVYFGPSLRAPRSRADWRTVSKLVGIGDLYPVSCGWRFVAVIPSEAR